MAGYHGVFQAIGSYDQTSKAFTAASLAANVTSAVMQAVGNIPTASATVWCEANTSTLTGTFSIQVTNDLRAREGNGSSAKWVTVQSVVYTNGVDPALNSASQITWINGSKYCRALWTSTSGTGTGACMISGVGA